MKGRVQMMSKLTLLRRICTLTWLISAGSLVCTGGVLAQMGMDLSGVIQQNMAFDQQMNAQLQGMMRNNSMKLQQLMQAYIQANGPRLEQEYYAYIQTTGMQIPFEQFVYYHMITAGGTNAGPALQQQQQNFRALQEAHRGLRQGFDSYNKSWEDNTRRRDRMADRYSNEAIRGNSWYVHPNTGETYSLPYTSGPGYYTDSHNTYFMDPGGQYYLVYPNGFYQPLGPMDPHR